MFKRDALDALQQWLENEERKPLVIRGARQVGKTALVRLFANEQKIELVEINLEEKKVAEFEREDGFDCKRALSEMATITGKTINQHTILFIDEIQSSSFAYPNLRYIKEKYPEIPVIAAGSLLELELHKNKFSSPVGRVEYLYLGPLTFSEFLKATDKNHLLSALKIFFTNKSEGIHNLLIEELKDYFFVGGMPEAIHKFIKGGKDYLNARKTQFEILDSYREDIRKYTQGKTQNVLLEIFDKLPFELGKKVIYSRLSSAKSDYIKEAIDILEAIYFAQKIIHSNCSGLPLKKISDSSIFKLFMLDVGLYNCMMGTSITDLISEDAKSLLNRGEMTEQFIAQHLFLKTYRQHKSPLYFWLRDKGSGKAEIDFAISSDKGIVPIEVKAGKTGKIRSLHQFMSEKISVVDKAIRFDLQYRESILETVKLPQENKEFILHNMSLYNIEELENYIAYN